MNLNFDMLARTSRASSTTATCRLRRRRLARRRARADRGRVPALLRAQGLVNEPTAFDGRSDYGPFIANGVPAGGLFTGAEGIKTPEQEELYGGRRGLPFDPCYHQACDTWFNLTTRRSTR